MAPLDFRYQRGGIWLPGAALWLDAHEVRPAPERVFVSHAHADHVARHPEVILSEPTARLMAARLGGERVMHVLPWHQPRTFDGPGGAIELTLLPAGHILGSAMAWIEQAGRSLLYTGDFKLRPSPAAEPCAPRPADVLIMETTYGRPGYEFPPEADVLEGILRFCRETLDNDETPVLLGYSLGKSQELLCGLADAGLPLALHPQVLKLTEVYASLGVMLPAYEALDPERLRGRVVVCPPNAGLARLRRGGRLRTAVLTGWAVEPGARFRFGADAAFALSDHADFPELIEFVKQVRPRQVYTLHGFAADFAQSLRELGFAAWALSEPEQLGLILGDPRRNSGAGIERSPARPAETETDPSRPAGAAAPTEAFAGFASTCAAIAASPSKRRKTNLLATYFRTLSPEAVGTVAVWFSGEPFAAVEGRPLQIGWAQLRDAACEVCGASAWEFQQLYLALSDTGETTAALFGNRPAAGLPLTLPDVRDAFDLIRGTRGKLAKRAALAGLLGRCDAQEARYLVKIITGGLRIGLKAGLVEEALAEAFDQPAERVRRAHLMVGHLGEVAGLAKRNDLDSAGPQPFRPLKCMLASPEPTAAALWKRLTPADPAGADSAIWVEDKYDGIRCQLHKVGAEVALYSRDLKAITDAFPEVVEAAQQLPGDGILDGELLAFSAGRPLPFAELQVRLGRRGPDLFLGIEIPVRFVGFDILWRNGRNLIGLPLRDRRRELEAMLGPAVVGTEEGGLVTPVRVRQIGSAAALEAAFHDARERGHEGLVVKDITSPYQPGRRGLAWLKLKQPQATLDCVVVAAEYGHGRRRSVLSDYTFAVRDDATGDLKTIGKAYTGLTDEEIARLTDHFLSRVIRRVGRRQEVEPDVVLEIAFDAVRESPRHASGLALRFPRIVRIREDKTPEEIDTVATARKLLPAESPRRSGRTSSRPEADPDSRPR